MAFWDRWFKPKRAFPSRLGDDAIEEIEELGAAGWTAGEIAEELGVTVKTVRKYLRRAKKRKPEGPTMEDLELACVQSALQSEDPQIRAMVWQRMIDRALPPKPQPASDVPLETEGNVGEVGELGWFLEIKEQWDRAVQAERERSEGGSTPRPMAGGIVGEVIAAIAGSPEGPALVQQFLASLGRLLRQGGLALGQAIPEGQLPTEEPPGELPGDSSEQIEGGPGVQPSEFGI